MLSPRALLSVVAAVFLSVAVGACSETTQSASIGAVLARDNESRALFVREAPLGLAAEEAGLVPGDEIVMIDGVYAKSLSAAEIRDKLRGEPGTFVELTIARGPVVIHVDVRRSELVADDLATAESETIDP